MDCEEEPHGEILGLLRLGLVWLFFYGSYWDKHWNWDRWTTHVGMAWSLGYHKPRDIDASNTMNLPLLSTLPSLGNCCLVEGVRVILEVLQYHDHPDLKLPNFF